MILATDGQEMIIPQADSLNTGKKDKNNKYFDTLTVCDVCRRNLTADV